MSKRYQLSFNKIRCKLFKKNTVQQDFRFSKLRLVIEYYKFLKTST